jgi:tetratricopeptide (TPR) repeat protein
LTLVLALLLAAGDLLSDGQRAFQAGDLARAEVAFREYVRLHPASAEGLSNLAAVLSRKEQYPEAIQLYQRALKSNPKLTPVHFNLGVALMKAGRNSEAAASFERFLTSHPQEQRAKLLRGLCLAEVGDLPAAIAALESVADDPLALYALAAAHARAGDENRAAALLARLDPVSAELTQGWIEYRRGRFAEARERFETALRLKPGHAPSLAALGRLALLENRDEEAITHLSEALKQNPSDAESTYQLGVLYDRNGKPAEGRAFLERSLSLRAGYADPLYQLGRIDFREGKFTVALERLQRAVKILPDQEAIRLLLARTYQALGRRAEAAREFSEVRRLKEAALERNQIRPTP